MYPRVARSENHPTPSITRHSEDARSFAGRSTPQQFFDYYLGRYANSSIAPHFQPVPDAAVGFARDWGMNTEVGRAAEVAEEISHITGVTLAEDVTGPYDVIVRAEAGSVDDLGKMVVSRVQLIDGITRTLTCPVVHL